MRRAFAASSLIAASFLVAVFPLALAAQSSGSSPQSLVSDPQALALASRAFAVLTGVASVQDVTLTGTATRVAGSDTGSGTVILKALGMSESRMDLSLSDGTRSEIRTSPNGAPQGQWLAPSGSYNNMAMHNCLTDAAWFFPALTVLSQTSNPNLSITYVGLETKNGISVQHLHFAFISAAQAAGPAHPLATLGATDVYLDATSLLPVVFAFNAHADNNALINIPVEVDFSNYQAVNGVQVPFRVQKFLNGSLFLDMTIQSAIVNSGLTDSAFASN